MVAVSDEHQRSLRQDIDILNVIDGDAGNDGIDISGGIELIQITKSFLVIERALCEVDFC